MKKSTLKRKMWERIMGNLEYFFSSKKYWVTPVKSRNHLGGFVKCRRKRFLIKMVYKVACVIRLKLSASYKNWDLPDIRWKIADIIFQVILILPVILAVYHLACYNNCVFKVTIFILNIYFIFWLYMIQSEMKLNSVPKSYKGT